MWSDLTDLFLPAFWETLAMVGVSGGIGALFGVPLGVLLYLTTTGGVLSAPAFNRVAGLVVNAVRSVPFIILLVAMLPVTRLIVGTTMGTWAAVVPLSAHLIPFFARVSQVGLNEVDHGLVEAARAMGCRRWHIVRHVLLPEALPALVGGATVTVIAMIGASAMAGAVGAGGLGDLAIRYGYERYETAVRFNVIAILIVLVTLVQLGGERLARRFDHRL